MAYCTWKSYRVNILPLDMFEVLCRRKGVFFLDNSLENRGPYARYSFLGIEPFLTVKTQGKDPFPGLRKLLNQYSCSSQTAKVPFQGGAVGYLSYDLGLALEKKVKAQEKRATFIPESFFSFFNTVVAFDHFKKRLFIFANGLPEKKHSLAKLLAASNLKKIEKLLYVCQARGKQGHVNPGQKVIKNTQALRSNFSREGYFKAIKKAKEYIRSGDIYQVNLSQQFSTVSQTSSPELYCRLRNLSPSNFSAYLDCGDFQILSSSPERFLHLRAGNVVSRPMKGTRPRGRSLKEDAFLRKELLRSAKDKAELLMITDLERNDLGRVCNYNSIKVTSLRQVEEYATVFQTTATVEGRLHKDKDRIDLLRASFPGGSITGCPKIRSMEIIEELEPARRSIYTGCLGYLSFSGEMDFNILIRSILKKGDKVSFGVGGGIVADSDPQKEYQETLVKAKAMMLALGAHL